MHTYDSVEDNSESKNMKQYSVELLRVRAQVGRTRGGS